jgi:hypothetical protein
VAFLSCLKRLALRSHLTHLMDPSGIVTKPSELYGRRRARAVTSVVAAVHVLLVGGL